MRLIDANELKEHLFVGADYDKAINDGIDKTKEEVFAFQCGWNDALKSVEQFAPTVDAVEVVRCKDCRFSHMTYSGECKSCDKWVDDDDFHLTLYLNGDFYCAFGERKDG